MNPSLLPYVAAVVSIVAFLFLHQVLRQSLGHGGATSVGAVVAGLVYYAAYVYRDEVSSGVSIPDGLLPLALLVVLVLVATATLSRRRPPRQIHGGSGGPRQVAGSPSGPMDNEPQASAGRRSRGRPYRRFRHYDPDYRYYDEGRFRRRPRPVYPDDLYPDDEHFRED